MEKQMKSVVEHNFPLFANEFVTCYSDYFLIHFYYFPFGNKKIYYKNIHSCEFHHTDNLGLFDSKLWGMSLSPVWWHCDMKRLGRKYYLLIDANQWPLVGLTMDDNEIVTVYNLITRQKINANQSKIDCFAEKNPLGHKALS